jgi:translocator protein
MFCLTELAVEEDDTSIWLPMQNARTTGIPALSVSSALALIAALAATFSASLIGSALTTPNLGWYATLVKPGFTPPDEAFPIVWTILYLLMAIAAWLVWRAPAPGDERRTALLWFGIQLVLNVAWSFTFFWLQSPAAGLFVIVFLIVAILITIFLFAPLSRAAALLFLPYLVWVCFAAVLNFSIWYLNAGA